jgi:hypothetical protein
LARVIELQAKGISKGDQGPFGGFGFSGCDGRFMGQAEIGVDPMAGACAFPDEQAMGAGGNSDAHAGDVRHPPAGFAVVTDQAFDLDNTSGEEGLALPAIKAKDAVGRVEDDKAFEVGHLAPALFAGGDEGSIERSREGGDLLGGEAVSHRLGKHSGSGGGLRGELAALCGIGLAEHLDH